MPELPEVETIARSLQEPTRGQTILAVRTSRLGMRGGRPIDGRALRRHVVGARILGWGRQGKYLLVELSSPWCLVVHLGMSGRLLLGSPDRPRESHTHAALTLAGDLELRFVDPRRFGSFECVASEAVATHPGLRSLGPEPLTRACNARHLGTRLAGSARAIKVALLDQSLVAGIGNIYASEALHLAAIDPRRSSGSLSPVELRRLSSAIKVTLRRAIDACGTSLRDYVDGWGVRGEYAQKLRVFDRTGQPCPRCASPIRHVIQGGRSTFFCAECQR